MEYCFQCKQPCHPGQTILRALGNAFHSDHFLCATCGSHIGTGDFYESSQYKGAPVCPNCFQSQFSRRCGFCDKPITGTSISALNKQFHHECFVCATCRISLTGTFYEHGGKPYCTQHYRELFCEKCMCCNKPIEGSSISALGGKWDASHFICHYSQCRKVIRAGETFYELESKPYCSPEHLSMARMELTKPQRAQSQQIGSPYGQPQSNPYGQPQSNPYGQPQSNPYGQSHSNQPQSPPYGQPQSPPYGQPQSNPYGQSHSNQPQSPPYGQPQSNPYGQSQSNSYGQPTQKSASSYGQPAQQPSPSYGQPAQQPSPSYGQPTQPSPSYGQPAQQPSPSYGQPTQQHSPSYGQPAQQPSPSHSYSQSKVQEPQITPVTQPGAPIPKPESHATLDQELDELDSLMESLDQEGSKAATPAPYNVTPKAAPSTTSSVSRVSPTPVSSGASRVAPAQTPTQTPTPAPVSSTASRASPAPTPSNTASRVSPAHSSSSSQVTPKGTVSVSVPTQPAVVPAPVAVSPPLPPEDEPKTSNSTVSTTASELDDIDSFLSSLDKPASKPKVTPKKESKKMDELNDLDKFMDELIETKPPQSAPKKKPSGSTSKIDMNELDDLMNSLLN